MHTITQLTPPSTSRVTHQIVITGIFLYFFISLFLATWMKMETQRVLFTFAPCLCRTSMTSLWAFSAATCKGVMKLEKGKKEKKGRYYFYIPSMTDSFWKF